MSTAAIALVLFCSTFAGEASELCDDNGPVCAEGGACYDDEVCWPGDTLCIEIGECN